MSAPLPPSWNEFHTETGQQDVSARGLAEARSYRLARPPSSRRVVQLATQSASLTRARVARGSPSHRPRRSPRRSRRVPRAGITRSTPNAENGTAIRCRSARQRRRCSTSRSRLKRQARSSRSPLNLARARRAARAREAVRARRRDARRSGRRAPRARPARRAHSLAAGEELRTQARTRTAGTSGGGWGGLASSLARGAPGCIARARSAVARARGSRAAWARTRPAGYRGAGDGAGGAAGYFVECLHGFAR